MAATLADVAERAGVSTATVSRVLNGNYPVAASTRKRVLRAVEELQYVVNAQARALAAASSDLVGILVNDVADPFFGLIASGIQAEVAEADLLPVICNTGGDPERELNYLTLLQRQRARGVVLTGGAWDDGHHLAAVAERARHYIAGGGRLVQCGRPPLALGPDAGPPAPEGAGVITVAFDNRGGARALTAHLISLGHTRIGYVSGPEHNTTTATRLEGHRRALADHPEAARLSEPLVVTGAFTRTAGYDAVAELLRRDPELTAVLASNDSVALGVCAALREREVEIPARISVAGFDDLPFSRDTCPPLTTVRIPLTEAGRRAGRLLLGRDAPPPGGVLTIHPELVARTSTGPAKRP
ncbi:LacI family transcriptional regulator [Mangrovactinospora gilvigrisea]|uniref:LacI family transcriptional regulator n=1 Tax=Mangrovactinospora gilvigrisea TaxID=1428644 RepID=A0A1J7BAA8_9ACTN|nr:LacI family DNA-binding transcriptional regulator [Mangrovactinospora gilvigrisea]OIV35550.1 LacI family transcriptional regulator [Mangrovactinospora gilvigrisea]